MARPSPGTSRALYESLSKLGTSWPRDALRPETSFGQTIIRAAERSLTSPVPEDSPPPQSASSQGVPSRINSRQLAYRDLDHGEKTTTEAAINALHAIRNGQASKENPVPDSILKPASNTIYYSRLASMLEQATKGNRVGLTIGQRVRLFFGMSV